MRIRLILLATLAVATVSLRTCGTSTTTVTEKPAAVPCTINISGAFSATTPCYITCVYGPNQTSATPQNQTAIAVTATAPSGDLAMAAFSLTSPAAPSPSTYSDGNAQTFGGGVFRTAGGSQSSWVLTQQPRQGSISITLSSIGVITTVNSQAGTVGMYSIHGTARATLPAAQGSGATGTVLMSVTF